MDLRHSLIPDDLIEDLLGSMPKHDGPDLLEHRDVPKYDYISFMQKMMDENKEQQSHSGTNQPDRASINGR
jgi:hypothetical protein